VTTRGYIEVKNRSWKIKIEVPCNIKTPHHQTELHISSSCQTFFVDRQGLTHHGRNVTKFELKVQLPNRDSKSRYQMSKKRRCKKLSTQTVNIFDGDYEDDSDSKEDKFESDTEEERSNRSKADRQTQEDAKMEDNLYEQCKKRWMELTKPVVRVSRIDERGRLYGRGSRKTAHTRVCIQPGMGEVVVNCRPFEHYFPWVWHREQIVATKICGNIDIQ
jgi:ribosomal protein L31